MAKIYLIRHGQASFSSDDYDKLSAVGVEQATLLNQSLRSKKLTPDIVITGSMLRHQQTAHYSLEGSCLNYGTLGEKDAVNITSTHTLKLEDERWNEYDHQNILAVYKDEFSTPKSMRAYLSNQADPMAAFQEHFIAAINQWIAAESSEQYSESWQKFTNRVIGALDDCANKHQGKTIFVYSSGGPISLIASYLLGLPLEQFIRINWALVNGGITKVISHGTKKKLMLSSLNEHNIFEQYNKKLITYT